MACDPAGHRGGAWLRKGCALLETALPVLADTTNRVEVRRMVMDRVVMGMDPRQRSVTIEARDTGGVLRAVGSFGTDTGGTSSLPEGSDSPRRSG